MISRVILFSLLLTIIIGCQMLYVIRVQNETTRVVDQNNDDYTINETNDRNKKDLLLEEMIFIRRKERANEMCRIHRDLYSDSLHSTRDLGHILVDEKHRLLYCYVPKVACTNWKRVFMILTGKSEASSSDQRRPYNVSGIPSYLVHRKGMFRRLSDYSLNEINYRLNNFTKYLFVRHPFERLLSAYRNKLEDRSVNSKYFQLRIGRQIVRKYRTSPSNRSLAYGDDVTFAEFVTYLTEQHASTYNEHWKPIADLCYPCFVKYDLIGKYETLYADSEFILNFVDESRITFPRVKLTDTTTVRTKRYYRSIPDNLIVRLYNIFILDFKLFDYNMADVLGYDIG